MKNKRKMRSADGADALADVNEQELAKDTERPNYREDTGTASDFGEAVPENFEKQSQGIDFIISETPQKALVAKSEETTDIKVSEDEFCENDEIPNVPPTGKAPMEDDGEAPQPQRHARQARTGGIYAAVIIFCLVASILLVIFSRLGKEPSAEQQPSFTDAPSSDAPINTDAASDAENVYSEAVKSSVGVVVERDGQTDYYSGLAVFDGGYVATLYEAVSSGTPTVITHTGEHIPAKVVGANASVNLALLSVGSADLNAAYIESAKELSAGEDIFAIGCIGEGRYPSSLLCARVSYAQRQMQIVFPDGCERSASFIQLDMSENSELSGCPIYNDEGKAIAIALYSEGDACFALPLELAMPVLECMKNGTDVNNDIIQAVARALPKLGILGEQAEEDGIWGVKITGFEGDSGDARVSLREGDLIWKLGGELVADTQTLKRTVEVYGVGEQVEVFIYRGGQRLSYFVTLGAK